MESNAIDVVYVLGTGSHWNNNELRFSLRAIEKNLLNFRKVLIVGEDPGFLTHDVTVISHPDEIGPQNADGNIIRKVLRACKEDWLTNDFLFINDDHLVMKPVEAAIVPPFHKGNLAKYPDKYWKENYWRTRLEATKNILVAKGYTANHFDCHTPIVFNKKKFVETMKLFNYPDGVGYTMKSLYGNVNCPGAPMLKREKKKVFKKMKLSEIEASTRDAEFVSFNDDGLNGALKLWLIRNFPVRSRFEATEIDDRVIEIATWFNQGSDYEKGVELYKKYFRGINMAYLYGSGRTELLMRKMTWKFTQVLKDYETN